MSITQQMRMMDLEDKDVLTKEEEREYIALCHRKEDEEDARRLTVDWYAVM